jgi:hypothetical protein
MTPYIKNICLTILTLAMTSCTGIKKDHQLLTASVEDILIDSVRNKNSTSNYADPLLLGNQFKITYASYGCFHYSASSVEIKKNNDKYFVTLNTKNNAAKSFLFDSEFGIALANFSQFYNRVLNSQTKQPKKNNFSMGEINKLTIEGGFRTINLFCDTEAEMNGFHTLMKSINFSITK